MLTFLRLLGGVSIEGPDGPLAGRVSQRHRLALLALLASAPAGLSRDKVIALLWPEASDERARHLLSDSLYRIHQAVGDGAIQGAGDLLRLDPDRLPSDLAGFRESLAAGAWEEAVERYGGPFLDGFHLPGAAEFSHWADGERQALAEAHVRALEAVAAERARAGDLRGAAAAWRQRVALDPYDSAATLRLLEALAAAGNPAGALRQGEAHARLLLEEFGTEPPPEFRSLVDALRAGGGTVPAPPGAPAPAPAPPPAAAPPASPPVAAESAPAPDHRSASQGYAPRALRPLLPAVGVLVVALGLASAFLFRSATEGEAPQQVAAAVPASPQRIAVLPFSSPWGTGEDYLADGITEEIITALSRNPALRVVARASVLPYRGTELPVGEVANALEVTHVLQGNVRQADGRVRIAVHLVDARSGTNLWAESYERPLGDLLALQAEIAIQVAQALQARFDPGTRAVLDRGLSRNVEAYDAYLRGRFLWHRRTGPDLAEATELFREAVTRDPEFAEGWVGLADALAVRAFYDYLAPLEAYPEALAATRRALEIDRSLPQAHASLGYITLYYRWRADEAEEAFLRAVELNPSYTVAHQWYANLLVATGRFDEAAGAMGRAREVNPLSLIANGALGWVYYHAGRYEEAVRQGDLALAMDPEWDLGHLWKGQALEALGRTDEAVASLRRAVERSGGTAISVAALGYALAQAGETDEARALLGRLVQDRASGAYRPALEVARLHLALGDRQAALEWLERAHDERSHAMVFLEVDPQLAPLRGEPAFRSLVERVGLHR